MYKLSKLRRAIYEKDERTVEQLLDTGPDVNKKISGITLLNLAITYGSPAMVHMLIKLKQLFHFRHRCKHSKSLSKAKGRHGANVNESSICQDSEEGEEELPIISASRGRNKYVVEALISAGARIEVEDAARFTPLYYAAMNGNTAIARLLLDHSSDAKTLVNVTVGDQGTTALHVATSGCCLNVVQVLHRYGAKLDIQNSAGAVPLHFVSEVRDGVKLAEFLIKNGAYLNRQTLGLTPLHLAILRNHCHIARLLIRHGADVHLRDHDGNSPLNYAITSEHGVDPDLVQLIMQGGHQPTEGDRRLLAGRLPEIVVSSPEKDLVEWVRERMRKPLDLRELTRVWLRAFLSRRSEGRSIEASVDKLPVPNLIKSYLMLTDFYS